MIKDNEESALDRGFYSAALRFEITEVQEILFLNGRCILYGVAKLSGKRAGLHSRIRILFRQRGEVCIAGQGRTNP